MDTIIHEYFDAAHKGLLGGAATKPTALKISVPVASSGLLVATPDPLVQSRPAPAASASVAATAAAGAAVTGAGSEAAVAMAAATAELTREIGRLRERLRTSEEDLGLASAKKESLKKANMQLSRDKVSLEQRLEIYFAEASANVEDAKYWRARAQEAVKAMSGMREYHAHEVKLLQRALLAASGRGQFRISDTAELIERLGRAVIQRDEALRDRTKLQDAVQASKTEFTAMLTDRNRLARALTDTQRKTDNLERINKTLLKGKAGGNDQAEEEISEEITDFERELRGFERRYAVLGEGVSGAEHVVKSQEAELRKISIRLGICEADNATLRRDVQHWRGSMQSKDDEISVVRKELQSFDERLLAATEAEAAAVERAQRLEKELSRTTVELRKLKDTAHSMEQTLIQDAAEQVVAMTIYSALTDHDDYSQETAVTKPVQLVTHTGEIALVSVVKFETSGKFALKAVDSDGQDGSQGAPLYLHLDPEIVDRVQGEEEEEEDKWHELIYGVGFSSEGGEGGKKLVLPEIVVNETLFMQPADLPLIVKLHKYDSRHWYVTGFDEILQRVVDLRIRLSDDVQASAAAKDPRAAIVSRLTLTENPKDESLALKFSP